MSAHEQDSSGSWQGLESLWAGDPSSVGEEGSELGSRARNEELYRQITRLGRRQWLLGLLLMVGELLVVLGFGALSVIWLWLGVPSEKVAGAFVLTLLIGVSLIRRPSWLDRRSLLGEPPRQFIETLLARNDAGFRALALSKWLLVLQVTFFLAWMPWHQPDFESIRSNYGFLVFWTALFLVAMRITRAYLEQERRHIKELESGLLVDDS